MPGGTMSAVGAKPAVVASPPAVAWHAAFWADDPGWSHPADGVAVDAWSDYSGNGRTASQGTASNRPVFRSSGVAGRAGVEFDGTNDHLATAAWSLVSQPFSYVVVASWASLGSGQRGVVDGLSSNPANLFTDTSTTTLNVYSGGGGYWRGPTISTGVHATRAKFHHTSSVVTVDGSGSGSSIGPGAGSGGTTGLTLGSQRGGSPASAVTIAFAGVFSGDVTAAPNWSAFCSWVSATYGVTLG